MRILYSTAIYILNFTLKVLSLFNDKIRLGVKGRAETFYKLNSELDPSLAKIWFHCASLGEYEQGLPVFKEIIKKHPDHQVVLSFFSPSGFEIKKNNSVADLVVYLPLDTPRNAKRFLTMIDPDLVLFTKYDIWPNFVLELGKSKCKSYLIASLFRKNQSYFKWYGSLMRRTLFSFEHIFTQNQDSKELIESIGVTNVSVTGDTRFDRVISQISMNNEVSFLNTFKDDQLTVIFGSSWPDDDKLFLPFINSFQLKPVKYIIAPHNISSHYTRSLQQSIHSKAICFSNLNQYSEQELREAKVFILDTIGYLNKAYSYADIAYVGGAAGTTGLHNILEPAVFGLPIIIGKNYSKFPEASSMIENGGTFSVMTTKQLFKKLETLVNKDGYRQSKGALNLEYVQKNSGAVNRIMQVIG